MAALPSSTTSSRRTRAGVAAATIRRPGDGGDGDETRVSSGQLAPTPSRTAALKKSSSRSLLPAPTTATAWPRRTTAASKSTPSLVKKHDDDAEDDDDDDDSVWEKIEDDADGNAVEEADRFDTPPIASRTRRRQSRMNSSHAHHTAGTAPSIARRSLLAPPAASVRRPDSALGKRRAERGDSDEDEDNSAGGGVDEFGVPRSTTTTTASSRGIPAPASGHAPINTSPARSLYTAGTSTSRLARPSGSPTKASALLHSLRSASPLKSVAARQLGTHMLGVGASGASGSGAKSRMRTSLGSLGSFGGGGSTSAFARRSGLRPPGAMAGVGDSSVASSVGTAASSSSLLARPRKLSRPSTAGEVQLARATLAAGSSSSGSALPKPRMGSTALNHASSTLPAKRNSAQVGAPPDSFAKMVGSAVSTSTPGSTSLQPAHAPAQAQGGGSGGASQVLPPSASTFKFAMPPSSRPGGIAHSSSTTRGSGLALPGGGAGTTPLRSATGTGTGTAIHPAIASLRPHPTPSLAGVPAVPQGRLSKMLLPTPDARERGKKRLSGMSLGSGTSMSSLLAAASASATAAGGKVKAGEAAAAEGSGGGGKATGGHGLGPDDYEDDKENRRTKDRTTSSPKAKEEDVLSQVRALAQRSGLSLEHLRALMDEGSGAGAGAGARVGGGASSSSQAASSARVSARSSLASRGSLLPGPAGSTSASTWSAPVQSTPAGRGGGGGGGASSHAPAPAPASEASSSLGALSPGSEVSLLLHASGGVQHRPRGGTAGGGRDEAEDTIELVDLSLGSPAGSLVGSGLGMGMGMGMGMGLGLGLGSPLGVPPPPPSSIGEESLLMGGSLDTRLIALGGGSGTMSSSASGSASALALHEGQDKTMDGSEADESDVDAVESPLMAIAALRPDLPHGADAEPGSSSHAPHSHKGSTLIAGPLLPLPRPATLSTLSVPRTGAGSSALVKKMSANLEQEMEGVLDPAEVGGEARALVDEEPGEPGAAMMLALLDGPGAGPGAVPGGVVVPAGSEGEVDAVLGGSHGRLELSTGAEASLTVRQGKDSSGSEGTTRGQGVLLHNDDDAAAEVKALRAELERTRLELDRLRIVYEAEVAEHEEGKATAAAAAVPKVEPANDEGSTTTTTSLQARIESLVREQAERQAAYEASAAALALALSSAEERALHAEQERLKGETQAGERARLDEEARHALSEEAERAMRALVAERDGAAAVRARLEAVQTEQAAREGRVRALEDEVAAVRLVVDEVRASEARARAELAGQEGVVEDALGARRRVLGEVAARSWVDVADMGRNELLLLDGKADMCHFLLAQLELWDGLLLGCYPSSTPAPAPATTTTTQGPASMLTAV